MNVVLVRSISIVAIVVFLLTGCIWREYSWRHSHYQLKLDIMRLKSQLEAITLKLIIDESLATSNDYMMIPSTLNKDDTNKADINQSSDVSCLTSTSFNDTSSCRAISNATLPINSIDLSFLEVLTKKLQSFNKTNNNETLSSLSHGMNQSELISLANTIFFDYSTLFIACFIFLMKFYEIYFFHSGVYIESAYVDNMESNKKFHQYVSTHYPATTFFLYSFLLIISIILWFSLFFMSRESGIIYNHIFITYAFKCIILHNTLTSPLLFVFLNFRRIQKYFPNNYTDWAKSLRKVEWWLWCISRLIGITKPEQLVHLVIVIVTNIFMMWPYRYFFYYRKLDYSLNQYGLTVFLLNMIIHTSLLYLWISYLQIFLFGSPYWIKNNPFLKRFFPISLSIFGQIGLFVVCILRTLWSAVVTGCSWYGCLIMIIFPLLYVFLATSHAPIITMSVYKHMFTNWLQPRFIDGFLSQPCFHDTNTKHNRKQQASSSSSQTSTSTAEVEMDQEQQQQRMLRLRVFASELFHSLIDKTLRNYILEVGPITFNTVDKRVEERKECIQQYKKNKLLKKKAAEAYSNNSNSNSNNSNKKGASTSTDTLKNKTAAASTSSSSSSSSSNPISNKNESTAKSSTTKKISDKNTDDPMTSSSSSSSSTTTNDNNDDEDVDHHQNDDSLWDLKLALEYTLAEFSLLSAKFPEAFQDVLASSAITTTTSTAGAVSESEPLEPPVAGSGGKSSEDDTKDGVRNDNTNEGIRSDKDRTSSSSSSSGGNYTETPRHMSDPPSSSHSFHNNSSSGANSRARSSTSGTSASRHTAASATTEPSPNDFDYFDPHLNCKPATSTTTRGANSSSNGIHFDNFKNSHHVKGNDDDDDDVTVVVAEIDVEILRAVFSKLIASNIPISQR